MRAARTFTRAATVAIVFSVAFAGCIARAPVDDADPNGILTTIGGEYVLDPQLANPGAAEVLMVFEPLLKLDAATFLPVAGAAQLPEISSDGLVYKFKIRDDSKFSDGTPVKPKDFAYGITRLCDPALKGPYASVAYPIVGCAEWSQLDVKKDSPERQRDAKAKLTGTGVRVTGENELTIQLMRAATYFASVLTLWGFSPVRESDVLHGGDSWTEPQTYIGNGPFVLSSWKHDDRMVYVPNRHYRSPPKIKQWIKLFISEPAVQLEAYRHDEVDVVSYGGGAGVASLLAGIRGDKTLAKELVRSGSPCTFYFLFNTRREPFDDPAVRLAFAKAIDRSAYVSEVLGGIGKPAVSLIAPDLPGHDPDDAAQAFDPAQARELLASSRYAGTAALRSIVVPYNLGNLRSRRPAGRALPRRVPPRPGGAAPLTVS